MIIAGGPINAKAVIYPIAERLKPGEPADQLGGAGADRATVPRRRRAGEDWVEPRQARGTDGRMSAGFSIPQVDFWRG